MECQLIAIFFFREVFPASAHLSMPNPPFAARVGCLFLVKTPRILASGWFATGEERKDFAQPRRGPLLAQAA